ncbi:hypothetical protein DE146DRAFT_395790 [Phaeosphaeria sp. MPI-PUGE-AT-0046c]|nr:hypothetical protein DE146DRAFT_395790 [Phaeosphaeria sp. MPI-PUGE-AT-0046c]
MVVPTPITTIAFSVAVLILGVPAAVIAIVFNSNWIPHVILDSKTFSTGPGKTTTINFGILTGPNDAVFAGAVVAIASSLTFILGLILIRHFTKHNGFGWLVFGPALVNLLSQIGCCSAVYIFKNKYPVATSTDQIRHIDGQYSTGGNLYTKEAWACSMEALYADREGDWANRACSRFGIARALTIPLVACAVCIFGMAYWQIRMQGGLGWLFGRNHKIIAAYKPKGEYIDLKG